MKKLFTLIASALFAVGASAQTSWNFSDWEAKEYTETFTKDGLTVTATESGKVTIAGSNKTVDDVQYTQCLKTGGSGGAESRTLSFAVDGACKIEVVLCTASSGNARKLNICAEKFEKENYLAQLDAGDNPAKESYSYTGEAATIYLGSYNSGINIYAIYVTPAEDNGSDDPSVGGGDEGKGDENPGGDEGKDDDGGNTGGNEGDTPGEGEGEGELIASWYFNNWSETTVNALKDDAAAGKTTGWSDVEKAADAEADKEPTETSKDNCFWAADASVISDGTLVANGTVIDELKGLNFKTVGNRALAIAVNYPTAQISSVEQTYKGGSYLWLGGKETDYFTIPEVPAGSVITIGVESHNNTDARGIELSNAGTNPAAPTTYEEQVWKVPAGETAVDVVVTNTNGCHLYYIEIAEGTADDDNTGEGEGEGDTTGIQQVAAKSGNSVIINLAGQKVDSSYKGIVVKDGKKYVQK